MDIASEANRGIGVRLADRKTLYGLLQSLPSPAVSEMAGLAGYDFVLLDAEHGGFAPPDILPALYALASTDCASIVRLRDHDPHVLGQCLDLKVDGILAPNVRSRAEALVRAMEYPPKGSRSFGASLHRATSYGKAVPEHVAGPRAATCLFVLIESQAGAEHAHEILAVDGVDGVIIGPYDLSADLGSAGDFSTSLYADAFMAIEAAAVDHHKLLGAALHPAFSASDLIARGHRLLIAAADTPLIREAFESHLLQARASSH